MNRFGSKMLTEYQNLLVVQVLARYCRLSSHVCSQKQAGLVSGLGENSKQRWRKISNMPLLAKKGISSTEPRFKISTRTKSQVKVFYAFVLVYITVICDPLLFAVYCNSLSHFFSYVARRCEFFPVCGFWSLDYQWPVFSGYTAPCWTGGICVEEEGVSSWVWATAFRAAGWDEGAELSCGQGSFLLSTAGSW